MKEEKEPTFWRRLKKRVYSHLSETQETLKSYQILWQILTYMEFMQHAYLIAVPFLKTPGFFGISGRLFNLAAYLQLVGHKDLTHKYLEILLYYFFAGFLAIGVSYFVQIWWQKPAGKPNNLILSFILRGVPIRILLINTIVIIPVVQTGYMGLFCPTSDPDFFSMAILLELYCEENETIINRIIAVFNVLMLSVHVLYYEILMMDIIPLNHSYQSVFKTDFFIPRLMFKILLPLYSIVFPNVNFDDQGEGRILYLLLLVAVFIIAIWHTYWLPPMANFKLSLQRRLLKVLLLWLTICILVNCGKNESDYLINQFTLYFSIGSLLLAYVVKVLQPLSLGRLLMVDPFKLKKANSFAKFAYSLISAVDHLQDQKIKELFFSATKIYAEFCPQNVPKLKISLETLIRSGFEAPLPEIKKMGFSFAHLVISWGSQKFKSQEYLKLLEAYLLHGHLDLRWQAVYLLQDLAKSSQSVRVKLAASNLTRTIEQQMVEIEYLRKEATHLDVESLLKYQILEKEFANLLLEGAILHKNFWENLASSNINVDQLKLNGIKALEVNQKVQNTIEDLIERSSQVKILIQYTNYLKLVMNDTKESKRVAEKIENTLTTMEDEKKDFDTKRMRIMDTSNICIIMASGSPQSMGQIISFNSEALKVFKYTQNEMAGENVKKLMPLYFGMHHDR